MTTSESSKAGGQGNGARAITRGEEARVREAVMRALALQDFTLAWNEDDTLWAISGWTGAEKATGAIERERLAMDGIVPGPAGWCWAAPAPQCMHPYCHAQRPHVEGSKQCEMMAPEATQAPPAWLTAAVLAALPASGEARDFDALYPAVTAGNASHFASIDMMRAALAHLVSAGEIEAGEGGAWRRWGVPEGWGWTEHVNGSWLLLGPGAPSPGRELANAETNGYWSVYRVPEALTSIVHGTASPPTLAAARSAALRACYKRGVFAPAALPKPAPPSPQPEDRPVRLRAALLAVLTPGPVRTTSDLLPALDAAMGEERGVAVARSSEAMKAAREVGARVDCVEWSLPPIPDGWGWRRVIASRWYLAPLDASDPEREAVASLAVDDGVGGIGGLMWHVNGGLVWHGCESVEEGQAAALRAARLAGLFAAPRAEAAPVAAPAPAEPTTTPLDALARILTGEAAPTMGDATAALAAFRAEILDAALTRTIDHAAARREDSEAGAAAPLPRAALAVSAARQRLSTAAPGTDKWSAAEIEVARTTGALLDAVGVEVPAATNPLRAGLDAADRATLDAVGRLREALAALCAGPGQWRWAVDESAPDAAVRLLGEMVARLDAMRGETWKDAMLRANKAERDAQAERDLTAYHRKRGDEAERERDEARALHRDQSHKAADAERALGFARRDLEVARGAIRRVEGERDEALAERTTEVEARMRAEREEESAARERDEALATIATVGAMLDPVLAAIAGGRPVAPLASSPSCSFCGKSSEETRIFVAGIGADPAVICDECAVLSAQIVEGAREGETVAIAGGREAGK